jgi:cation diffusion facilitator family transporter
MDFGGWSGHNKRMNEARLLQRYAWLSIATAVCTIGLKMGAYWLTGSVGLLSDALESLVNLVTAVFALMILTIAARPPDSEHEYGHTKAEYFSSGFEGALILFAALMIILSAGQRLLNPQPLEQVGFGLAVSTVAAVLNGLTGWLLIRAGQQHNSITLTANGRHLMTDVWTTVGVLIGVALVALTDWLWLDPVIAILVAVQIMVTGVKLLRQSVGGLMDEALPAEEVGQITAVLESYASDGVQYHALRTRRSGAQRFISVHVQVPGAWSVQKGHDLAEQMEADLRQTISPLSVFIHMEPKEDPASWNDVQLNRTV